MIPARVGELCAKADQLSSCGRRKSSHQLPGNTGSVSSPSCLFTRPEGAPCSGPFGQHDRGGQH